MVSLRRGGGKGKGLGRDKTKRKRKEKKRNEKKEKKRNKRIKKTLTSAPSYPLEKYQQSLTLLFLESLPFFLPFSLPFLPSSTLCALLF